MNIGYVCADRGIPIGGTKGASIHVRGLVQALRLQHQVTLFAASQVEGDDQPVIDTGFDPLLKQVRNTISENSGRQIAGELHGLACNSLLAEALSEQHRRQPLDLVYERYSLWSYEGLRFARRHGIPFFLEVNAPLVEETQRYRALQLESAARAIEKRLLTQADVLFVPSPALAVWARQQLGRTGPIQVVPNGVDSGLFANPRPLPVTPVVERLRNSFVVVFVGSLKPWHGVEVLLNAMPRVFQQSPDAHLLVIGDGPMRELVAQKSEQFGARSMTWLGAIEHDLIPSWLSFCDLGVAPYPKLENFYFSPLKVVEYQAAGLPVVASDIGDLSSQIEHQVDGGLFQPGNPRSLADAIIELAVDRDQAQAMGARGKARTLRQRSWSTIADLVVGEFSDQGQSRTTRAVR